jgi:signal transduction histidine kinase
MYLSLILLILVLAIDAVLGLMVWLQGPRKTVNSIFALLTLAFIIWSGTGFYDQTTAGLDNALPLMWTLPFVGGVMIAYFITLFALYFPESHPNLPHTRRNIIWILNLVTVPLLVVLIFAPQLMIAKVIDSGAAGNNIVIGPLYALFPLYFLAWIVFSLSDLFVKFRHSKNPLEHLQLNYIFLGFLSFTGVGFLTNVVIPVLAHSSTLARFGFLSTLFIVGFFGYTIVTHRLFNIRLLVARSVAYLLLLVTLSGLYGVALFAIANLLFPHSKLTPAESSVFIALAVVLSFTLQPLRRFFEKVTDGIFFRDRYDSQTVLNNVGSILAAELHLDDLLDKSLKEICESLHITGGRFVILDKGEIYKRIYYRFRPKQEQMSSKTMHKLHPGTLVADELEPGERKDILDKYEVRVSLELWTKEELVGYLLLGDKLSGDVYSNQDVMLLEILRKELAVAIVNARAYEEIARFNATLQDQVRKATERLRAANRNLKVLDKAKDEFISMASHQLGTPLTAITGYLSMTLDNDKHNLTAEQRQYVEYALEASERMGAMSSDLLNVSRLSAGRFIIRREPVDLAGMVTQEIEQLQAAADRKGLKLTFDAEKLPPVVVDPSKTRQVIMNFIDNAIYYTEQGSIQVKLEHVHDAVAFSVIDTGIGVPLGERAKLFTKFYRAANAKEARPDGTGLGLYLAKKVIEDQGGSIIFQSEIGKGSTFGFVLPIIHS